MTYTDLLQNRRSVRNYREDPVPVDLIREMIHESILAPSAGNGQPWQFIIVTDKALLKAMSDESKQYLLDRIAANPQDYARKYQGMLEKAAYNVFYNAPCLIIILGPKDNHTLQIDCSLIACYVMFSASDRGLGTCWVGLGAFIHDPELLKELGITTDLQIVAPIILGYPKHIPGAAERKEPQVLKVIS